MDGKQSKQIGKYRNKRPQNTGGKMKKLEGTEEALTGLLFTSEGIEGRARFEADKLLHRYFDEQTDTAADDNDDMDAADALAKQTRNVKEQKKWEWLDSGAKHVLFCKLVDTDIAHIADWFVTKCQSGPECRFLMRVYPVYQSGKVSFEVLDKMFERYLKTALEQKPDGSWPTYRIEYIKRNNDALKRTDVFDSFGIVKNRESLNNVVNLSRPDVTLIVQVQKRTLLFAYAKNYDERRKFSLRFKPEDNEEVKEEEGKTDSQKSDGESVEADLPSVEEAKAEVTVEQDEDEPMM